MLNNMKYWVRTFLFNANQISRNTSNTHKAYAQAMTDIEGVAVTGYNGRNSELMATLGYAMSKDTTIGGVQIRIGAGNTLATTDETYCLENDVTDNFSLISNVSDVDFPDGKTRLILTANYKNNTTEDITINEIGFAFINQDYDSSNTVTVYNKVLFDRKSLKDGNFTPVTVGAGESKIFVYAIEM